MANPNIAPGQGNLLPNDPFDLGDKPGAIEQIREQDNDDEVERLDLGLDSEQYQRFKRLYYELEECTRPEAWMKVTGKSLEDYYLQCSRNQPSLSPDVPEETDTPVNPDQLLLEQDIATETVPGMPVGYVRPIFTEGYRPRTDDDRYPVNVPLVSHGELLERLKQEFVDNSNQKPAD